MAPSSPTPARAEVAEHRQILERATDYVRGLPPDLFADETLSIAAARLCMALVEAIGNATEARR